MTEVQRQNRAAFIREQPLLWFALLYASAFLSAAVALDGLRFFGAVDPSLLTRYLVPLSIALPPWLGLRSWSRRANAARGVTPPQSA